MKVTTAKIRKLARDFPAVSRLYLRRGGLVGTEASDANPNRSALGRATQVLLERIQTCDVPRDPTRDAAAANGFAWMAVEPVEPMEPGRSGKGRDRGLVAQFRTAARISDPGWRPAGTGWRGRKRFRPDACDPANFFVTVKEKTFSKKWTTYTMCRGWPLVR